MKWIGKVVVLCMSVLVSYTFSGLAVADNAEVLPKGISRIRLDTNFYKSIDTRYNDNGDQEDVAIDYNTILNSTVFPALQALEGPPFNLGAGNATIGQSMVSFDYEFTRAYLSYERGITEKLTIGIIIPYWWAKNKVLASVDSSGATVGKNPVHGQVGDPFGGLAPFIPVALGGVRLSTEDVQNLLGSGLDVDGGGTIDIPGFGFNRFETWSKDGIGDIRIGGRYQYFKNDSWRLSFTGGVQFPTGYSDNPDSLVDYGWSDDAYTLLFHFNNDYIAIKKLLLNTTLRYHLALPDHETVRVPDDVDLPLTVNKEKVDRDIGDVFEFEATGSYSLTQLLNVFLLYKYGYKWKDSVDGNQGYVYQSLEDETNYKEQVYVAGLSCSTIPLYQEKKFPVPLKASLYYRDRFDGENLFDSKYIGFDLQVYF